jgi:hypothetical protein
MDDDDDNGLFHLGVVVACRHDSEVDDVVVVVVAGWGCFLVVIGGDGVKLSRAEMRRHARLQDEAENVAVSTSPPPQPRLRPSLNGATFFDGITWSNVKSQPTERNDVRRAAGFVNYHRSVLSSITETSFLKASFEATCSNRESYRARWGEAKTT